DVYKRQVTVTDANGCSNTTTVNFVQPPALNIDSIKKNNIQPCYGNNNGSITIYVSGGVPPYLYNIGSGNQSSNTFTNLAPGVYIVTITDANNCTKVTNPITIVQPPQLVIDSISKTNVFPCYGNSNGTITVYVSGGVSPYLYNIGYGAQTSNVFSGLNAGTYQITITDNLGCSISTTNITITQPDSIQISFSNIGNVDCHGACNGFATVQVVGGTPGYTYQWSASANNQTTQTAINLCGGAHFVTITDANGCTNTNFVLIQDTSNLQILILSKQDPTCYGDCNGSISITAINGYPPYSYLWDNGSTNPTRTNLCAGTYFITVTDDSLCIKVDAITLINPPLLNASLNIIQNINCYNQCSGVITANVNGGVPPYTYTWNTGSLNDTIYNLCTGFYYATISDNNGCTIADTIFLPQPTAIINTFNITNSIKCFGNCDGVITATTLGGIPPYNYTWSNGQNTNTATNVCSGYTYLTITDNNGCTKIDSVFMSQPDSLTLQFTTIPAACSGVCEGIITVTVSGGTPSYNYLWSNGDIVSTADSLCAGNYTITVTDANGCTKVDTIQVPDTSSLNLLVTNIISPTCYGTCNGQIIVSATGGTQPYFFMWNTGQSGNTISNLCAGIYTVTLTDANNCTRTATVNLTEPQQLNDSIVIAHPISCYNFCDGEIAVYPFGGTPPYMIHLNGIINPDLSHLCAGTYQLIIIDANGCTKIDSVTILQPQQLSIIINITEPIKCFGNCNGIVQATVNGGNLPYFYNWSNGDNTNTADSLCAGILTLTVTDNNNCIKKDSILITQPNPLTIDFTNVTATTCGKCVGSATAMVSGGTQPYTYQWDANANNQTTATADSLCVNIYFVTATDANGCTTVNNIAIIDTSNLTINVTDLNHITCAGWCNGSATVEASGGYPPYVFLWSNGQTTATATNLCAGTYFVTVTDDSLCSRVEMIEITDQNILTVNANITPVACAGMCNAQIVLVPQGGTPPYASYQWSISGLSDSVAHDLCPGMYYFTVTDSNGCQYSDTVIIEDQPPMQVLINVVSPIKCNGDCNGVLLVQVIGAYGYNILWSTNDTTDTIAGLCFGNYSVTITGQGSCIDSTNIYLTQPEPLNISFVNIAQVGCHGDCSGQVTAVVNGGTAPYTYQWGETANFATTPNIDSLCANLYFITITDNNSCTKTSYIEITDTSNLQLLIVDSANIRCYGNCDGWIEVQAQGGYPPYNYIWFTQPPQTGNIINNLCAGQYIVKVVDDSLCSRSRLIQLTQPDSLYIVYLMKPPLCYSDSNGYITITINGGVMPYSILWNTGSTDTTLTNLTGGNYSVTITDANNCSITDTLSLIEPNLILDSVKLKYPLCNNFDTSGAIYITNIIGGTPPYTVKWNIGILSDSIVNIGAGVYYYTITDANNCNKTDSVILNSLITVNAIAIPDTTICYGDSVQIFGFGGKEFYWTPGSTLSDSTIFNPYAKPLNSTTYYYIAYDSICFDIDSVFVGIYPTVTVNAGENQTIIYDQITNISGTISGTVASYYWTPSKWLTDSTSLTTTAHPFETIVYYLVAITPEGCKFKDSVKINVLPRLRIPTGITPNGDGINDVWIIDLIEKFPNCEVMIFNRWGEQLFYSKGYPENERWDGTYKGKPLPAGTYYYVILLHDEAFPDPLTGPITIKR
ncbi:MAG: gliding motility-associated C-terminal domain-containing protein, partial [Bacteroidales bacterium]|nr:gliding motility-associated C-terminal domain-containing protein [Bacteroidales bacterium]